MSSPFFRFKQFTVWHDQCAMKVGTDGVLLGAWCPLPITHGEVSNSIESAPYSTYKVLDIGTGSGLVALILAQRLSSLTLSPHHIHIDAIDIDHNATQQATHNFAISPFSNILHAHHATLQDWQNQPYDLIVSNPPFFQHSLKNPDSQRATARHTDSLTYDELITHATRLLQPKGILALILPIEAENDIRHLAQQHGLYPTHITHVHTKPDKPAKRILIAFHTTPHYSTLHHTTSHYSTLHIESTTSPRSEEYQQLTKDLYL